MNFPLRVILALLVLAAFHGIAAWGVITHLRARRLTEPERWARIGVIVFLVALLVGRVVFVWPACWD